jgi:hypothetical protein
MILVKVKGRFGLFFGILFFVQSSLLVLGIFCIPGFPFLPPIKIMEEASMRLETSRPVYFYSVSLAETEKPDVANFYIEDMAGRKLPILPVSRHVEFLFNGASYVGVGVGKFVPRGNAPMSINIQAAVPVNNGVRIAYQVGGLMNFFITITFLVVLSLIVSGLLVRQVASRSRKSIQGVV